VNLRVKLLADYYIGGTLQAILKPATVLLGKIVRRDHNLTRCSSLTFIKMMGGGSLVIAYPALLATKNSPQIKQLRLITTSAVKPFDEIIVIRDDSAVTLVGDALSAIRKVFRCDAIVDLEVHSRLTTVFSVVTCAVNRVGFYTGISFWRQKLATHLLFCNISNGIYYFYDQIAALFGGQAPDMGMCVSAFRKQLGVTLRTPDPASLRIALAPCCSELGRERMLQPNEWVEVFRRRFSREDPGRKIEIRLMGGRRRPSSSGPVVRRDPHGVSWSHHRELRRQNLTGRVGPRIGGSRRVDLHRFRAAALRPAAGHLHDFVLGPDRSGVPPARLGLQSRRDPLPQTAVFALRACGAGAALPRGQPVHALRGGSRSPVGNQPDVDSSRRPYRPVLAERLPISRFERFLEAQRLET
jgi:hypothetical protein